MGGVQFIKKNCAILFFHRYARQMVNRSISLFLFEITLDGCTRQIYYDLFPDFAIGTYIFF
jgi:hypothetical protein